MWTDDYKARTLNALPLHDQRPLHAAGGDPTISYYQSHWALAPDEARLFVAEGAQVVELALPSLRELSRTPVDAGILDMACTAERLWIAGGTQGLWRIELADETRAAAVEFDATG